MKSETASRSFAALLLATVALVPAAFSATAQDNYDKHCAACHGSDGKARTRLGRKSGAKDLSDKERLGKLSDTEAFNTVKNGRKNARGEQVMDPFAAELSDKEITEIVAFVRTFSK